MMHRPVYVCILLTVFLGTFRASAQPVLPERVDTATVSRILDEGMHRSKVMDLLSWLTDVHGPRLTGSPGYRRAAEWARKTLEGWGVENARLESAGFFGRGWTIGTFQVRVLSPAPFPVLCFPKAWSPGVDRKGPVVYLDAKTDSVLTLYRGKLKGAFVLSGDPQQIKAHFEPLATRETDSSLLVMANADIQAPRGRRRFGGTRDVAERMRFETRKLLFCQEEGAAAVFTSSRGDEGTMFVQGASVPSRGDTSRATRINPYDPLAPRIIPQFVMAAEHYNRLVRMIAKSITPQMEAELEVEFSRPDSGYNVIAEIPGTDLKHEVVMIGAHLDSWHGGTGATDNATGVASCMEAMRILKALGLTPRRTVRIGLWSGEEQGLLGSREYVRRHFGERRPDGGGDSLGSVVLTQEGKDFCAYFNNDNGTGKVRGVYMQGNEGVRSIFRAWLAPFRSMGASTLTPLNTGSTDHVSFDGIGLPGFQFIQDDIEYFSRTWHSTQDLYDRVQEDDMKEAATVMATFAYNAAQRDAKLPRKEPVRP